MRVLKVQAFVRSSAPLSLHRAERCELIDEAQGAGRAEYTAIRAASKIELKYDSKCFFNGMYVGNRAKEGGRGGRGVVTRTYESNYRRVRPRWEAPTARRRPVDATHGFKTFKSNVESDCIQVDASKSTQFSLSLPARRCRSHDSCASHVLCCASRPASSMNN